MNYELAKKLEKAGWKFKDFIVEEYIAVNKEDGGWLKPTLEELIEACGESFLSLGMNKMGKGKKWHASTETHQCDCKKKGCKGINWEVGEGSTPLEAVANLWLALNKN